MLGITHLLGYGPNEQGRTGHYGNAKIAARLFLQNAWQFKDIFREFEAFLK
jgi:hypothetical protein